MQTESKLHDFLTEFFEYCNSNKGTNQSYNNKGDEDANQIKKLKCCIYSQLVQDIFQNIKNELNNSSFNDYFMNTFDHHKNDYSYSDDLDSCMGKINQMLNLPEVKTVIFKHLDALDTIDLSQPYDENKKLLAS
jgi:hypothetical protein